MKPLWKLRSGLFAGWNFEGQLYDAGGKHVGYFHGSCAVGCNGRVVGEMYDEKFIGVRTSVSYPIYGSSGHYSAISACRYVNYCGNAIGGWKDPDF